MLRTSADPQPFTSRAEGFCEAPDRSSTVLSRFGLVSAAILAPAIRSVSWRVLLARWPKSDVGDAGVAGVRSARHSISKRGPHAPQANSKDISKLVALITTATAVERSIARLATLTP
jgi:hypothetical protein